MKKSIKIILFTIFIIVCLIVLDSLQARIFKSSPIISWKETLEDSDSWVDKGILIDTYYCTKEKDILTISWKLKGSKYTCPIDDVTIDDLSNVNNQIIEYFSSNEVKYDNFSFNYIDEKNKVVIVGLFENNKEKQEEFKNVVINSNLIKFVQGENLIDHDSLEDELDNIKNTITNIVSSKQDYTNFAACYVDLENKTVVVTLVDNNQETQDYFRRNILNSKYITFIQGGPYTTSNNKK